MCPIKLIVIIIRFNVNNELEDYSGDRMEER